MEYFKEIEIPSWNIIQTFCMSVWNDRESGSISFNSSNLAYLNRLLRNDIIKSLGLYVRVKTAIMFTSPPRYVQNMHIDGFSLNRNNASDTALNLPILNCETGPMFWYSGNYSISESTDAELKYLKIIWDNAGPKLECTKIINKPTLVKINIPHRIENQSDSTRLMLSVRFDKDIPIG